MEYVEHRPNAAPLATRVEVVFCLSGYQPEHRSERVVPNGRCHLIFALDGQPRQVIDPRTREPVQTCRGAWFSGVHARYFTISTIAPEFRLAVVQFAPGGAHPFVQRPMSEFNDRVVEAEEIFGPEISSLLEQLRSHGDGEEVINLLEEWLSVRLDSSIGPPEYLAAVLAQLERPSSGPTITELVEEKAGVSYKHFLEVFARHVGPNPKRMQRIFRFTQLLEQMGEVRSFDWARLSLDLGYVDQSHLIREFREFCGYRPSEFERADHERQNFFPDDDAPSR